MTDTRAFSFGTEERSWWATSLDPEVQAQRAMESQLAEQAALKEAEFQRVQELTQHAGPALIEIIRTYSAQNIPAKLDEVSMAFNESFPSVNFREILEVLVNQGLVHMNRVSQNGFMGAETWHLHLL